MKPTLEEQLVIDEGLAEISETRVAEAKEKEEDRIDRLELEWLTMQVVHDIRDEEDSEELRWAEQARREREDDEFYARHEFGADWCDDGVDYDDFRLDGERADPKGQRA